MVGDGFQTVELPAARAIQKFQPNTATWDQLDSRRTRLMIAYWEVESGKDANHPEWIWDYPSAKLGEGKM